MRRPVSGWPPRARRSSRSTTRAALSRCRVPFGTRSAATPRRGSSVAALGVALCAAACAHAATGHTDAFGASQARTYAEILRMTDSRRLDTSLVRRALASHSRPLRVAAARAVGQVHGREMSAELRRLLGDIDTAVAANAAFSLGLMRDTSTVAALVAALRRWPVVGVEAAWALGQIGGRPPRRPSPA